MSNRLEEAHKSWWTCWPNQTSSTRGKNSRLGPWTHLCPEPASWLHALTRNDPPGQLVPSLTLKYILHKVQKHKNIKQARGNVEWVTFFENQSIWLLKSDFGPLCEIIVGRITQDGQLSSIHELVSWLHFHPLRPVLNENWQIEHV